MGLAFSAWEIEILNGGFDNQDHWTTPAPWSIAGGLLILNQIAPGGNPTSQNNIPFIVGNLYEITLTVSNPNWINPGSGFRVILGGGTSNTITAAGVHTVTVQPIVDNQQLLLSENDHAIGNYCEIDNISIVTPAQHPIITNEITLPNNLLFDVFEADATDYWARYASLNGKSKILISWNQP